MIHKFMSIAAIAAVSFGCTTAQQEPIDEFEPYTLSSTQIELIETTVRQTFDRGTEMRIEKLDAVLTSRGVIVACGERVYPGIFGSTNDRLPFRGMMANVPEPDQVLLGLLRDEYAESYYDFCAAHGMNL